MPANLAIDDALLSEALKEGAHKTKKDTVNAALQEFIQRRKGHVVLYRSTEVLVCLHELAGLNRIPSKE